VFSSPESDWALERLQGKSYFGVNYDNKNPIIKEGRPTTPFPNITIKIQYYVCYLLAVCSDFVVKMRGVKNLIHFKNPSDYSEAHITSAMALIKSLKP